QGIARSAPDNRCTLRSSVVASRFLLLKELLVPHLESRSAADGRTFPDLSQDSEEQNRCPLPPLWVSFNLSAVYHGRRRTPGALQNPAAIPIYPRAAPRRRRIPAHEGSVSPEDNLVPRASRL